MVEEALAGALEGYEPVKAGDEAQVSSPHWVEQ
jgi:hypothetical protein